jgi:hypothetical protein
MAAPSTPAGNDSHFSAESARAIFRRAAEHEEMARSARRAGAHGLSLADLQAVGAEAGIDPKYVAAAAAELSTEDSADDTPWWYAGPATVRAETVVPGSITDGPVWVAMVRELRDTFGTDGVATQLGGALEWSFEPQVGGDSTRVDVTPEPHGTRIRLTRSKTQAARMGTQMGGTLGICGLFVGAAIFTINGFDLVGLAFMLMIMALGAALTGLSVPLYRRTVRREQRAFDRLVDRLELIALKANAQSAQSEAHTLEADRESVEGVANLDTTAPASVNGTRKQTRS